MSLEVDESARNADVPILERLSVQTRPADRKISDLAHESGRMSLTLGVCGGPCFPALSERAGIACGTFQ